MEIRVLRYFLAVAQEGGINRAAQMLHITQPTLSRQIAQLEEEIGAGLFVRGSRPMTLTSEGQLLYRRAQEILELVDRTEQELTQQTLMEGRIVIGCGEMAAVAVLCEIIASFHQKYPQVAFDLFTGNADLIKEQMEKGLIDLGVLLEPVDTMKFEFIRWTKKERWVVLMRPDDSLAGKKAVTPEDLKGAGLIFPGRRPVQNEIFSWLGSAFRGDTPSFTSTLSTNSALLARQGLGYSLVIEGSVPFLDPDQLVFRPLNPELYSGSVFAWKKQMLFSPVTEAFIEHLKCFLSIDKG